MIRLWKMRFSIVVTWPLRLSVLLDDNLYPSQKQTGRKYGTEYQAMQCLQTDRRQRTAHLFHCQVLKNWQYLTEQTWCQALGTETVRAASRWPQHNKNTQTTMSMAQTQSTRQRLHDPNVQLRASCITWTERRASCRALCKGMETPSMPWAQTVCPLLAENPIPPRKCGRRETMSL